MIKYRIYTMDAHTGEKRLRFVTKDEKQKNEFVQKYIRQEMNMDNDEKITFRYWLDEDDSDAIIMDYGAWSEYLVEKQEEIDNDI